jgi:hypothetical protein
MSYIFKHMFKHFEITNQPLCLMGGMLNDLTNNAINVKNRFLTKIWKTGDDEKLNLTLSNHEGISRAQG